MRDAAHRCVRLGARAALIKGGHLTSADAVDVLYDGRELHELRAPRVRSPHTHGTGCMLSAAITAGLARGQPLLAAVQAAKQFITAAVTRGLALGKGNGPANVLAWLDDPRLDSTR
jgi:hydroxymethylpyrimidine/phosphomethylpyrimidine kinase